MRWARFTPSWLLPGSARNPARQRYSCAPMLEAVLVLAATVADLFRPRWRCSPRSPCSMTDPVSLIILVALGEAASPTATAMAQGARDAFAGTVAEVHETAGTPSDADALTTERPSRADALVSGRLGYVVNSYASGGAGSPIHRAFGSRVHVEARGTYVFAMAGGGPQGARVAPSPEVRPDRERGCRARYPRPARDHRHRHHPGRAGGSARVATSREEDGPPPGRRVLDRTRGRVVGAQGHVDDAAVRGTPTMK